MDFKIKKKSQHVMKVLIHVLAIELKQLISSSITTKSYKLKVDDLQH